MKRLTNTLFMHNRILKCHGNFPLCLTCLFIQTFFAAAQTASYESLCDDSNFSKSIGQVSGCGQTFTYFTVQAVRDAVGRTGTKTTDTASRLIKVNDNSGQLHYSYDSCSNITSVRRPRIRLLRTCTMSKGGKKNHRFQQRYYYL